MSVPRVLLWAPLLVLAATAGVRADSFDGIYLNRDGGNVAYFSLLRHGDRISGDYTVVMRNPETSGGILRSHFTVSGNTEPNGALLTIVGETPESQAAMSYRWLSRRQRDGFSIEIPLATGLIATPVFRQSSVAAVNGRLAALTGAVERELEARADKLAALRSEQELHADLKARLVALSAVAKASAELDRARSRRQALEATVAQLQGEADRKHRLASEAGASMLSSTRRRLADLEDQANYADFAVASAKADVTGATAQLSDALQNLQVARRNLTDHDTRIASLLAARERGAAAPQAHP